MQKRDEKTGYWLPSDKAKVDPRVQRLEDENARLKKQLGLIEGYCAEARTPPKWLRSKKGERVDDKEATACLQFSDWHLDEVVDPGQIGGLNAYNRDIAYLRLKRWANKACEMGEMHKHKWSGAVIFFNGDFVSGSIHEELAETNADYLPGTMVTWAPLIAAAFKQVADFYGALYIPAVVGNHGRMNEKKQAKGRGRNSWDWLLAQMVKAHLADDKRIDWDISEGSYIFAPIYGRHVFVTHGDEATGGGGAAGVMYPMSKIHANAMRLGQAHGIVPAYSVIGHWHQTVLAHQQGVSGNGAGKGYDEYAASLRLKPEAAQQNWFIETAKYGVTLAGSLFLEDRKAEGW